MPKKPVRFLLEFSGTTPVCVDGDGAFIRPPNAAEIAKGIADELNARFIQGNCKFRVSVKPLN